MGNLLSLNLEEQYRRNEKFLQSLNEIAIERQIQLRNQMALRQRAFEIAKNRDLFLYYSTFYFAATIGLFTGRDQLFREPPDKPKWFWRWYLVMVFTWWMPFLNHKTNYVLRLGMGSQIFRRTKRAYFLFPLLPLTFVNLYYYDLAYGNKLHRLRMEAEHIMIHESDILSLPCGLPTPSSIDQGRMDEEDKKKMHPPLP